MIDLHLPELSKIEVLRLIHLFMCLFGGVFLILIWQRAKKLDEQFKQDLGLVFIACALFLWVAMDLYRFLGLMKPGHVSLVIKTFSAYNNGFFLASLPFFSHSFINIKERFSFFQNKMKWAVYVFLVNVGFVFFYSMFWGEKQETSVIVNYFDFIYSTLTYALLGFAIIESFRNREYYRNSFFYFAIILVIALICVQIGFAPFFKIDNYDILSASAFISQNLLILVFIVLAQGWIIDYHKNNEEKNTDSLSKAIGELKNELMQKNQDLEQLKTSYNKLLEIQSSTETKLKEKEASIQTSQQIRELSERELEVLSLIDKSYTEIGNLLHIARETVITHKKNIESKLGINNKTELIDYAIQIGILKSKSTD